MRKCQRCGVDKPLLEFPRKKRGNRERGAWCQECVNEYQEWMDKGGNPGEIVKPPSRAHHRWSDGAPNRAHHTEAEWRALICRCGFRCASCGKFESALTKDHIIPRSKGGSDLIENIQPLCLKCNSVLKGTNSTSYLPLDC